LEVEMSLQRLTLAVTLCIAVTAVACSGADGSKILAQSPETTVASRSEPHHMDHAPDIKWGPAPPIFPAGALFAVVQGDPSVAGALFTVRLRFPNGYILPPHTHPTDEHVTVLRGTFSLGFGENISDEGLRVLKEGGFVTAGANMPHFATARGITEVQVTAIGPFQLTYVHPEDDPTK
jgi:quercetin dioxygenase-like cupin family protein